MQSSELDRIRGLSLIFEPSADGRVIVGIGDDAAVLAPSEEPLVWTIDAAVEGVHFRRAWLSFEDIGFRSTMAAVSDLGAMGASPLGVLSALILPEDVGDEELFALARGQREAAEICGAAVIGGNLARGQELSITTTALGRAPRALTRSGARPGDALWLLGPVGLARAGLAFLQAERVVESAEERACVDAWRRPRARAAEGLSLRGVASAAVDVSDGLARDVGHVARASGVVVVIDVGVFDEPGDAADPIRRSVLQGASARLGVPASELALFGGEDYAIAFTAAEDAAVPGALRIGWIEARNDRSAGVFARDKDGSHRPLAEGGFDHFGRGTPPV